MLKIVGITPHPPLIIPEVGRGDLAQVSSTIEGFQRVARQVVDHEPECLVIITPHGPVLREGIAALAGEELSGDFSQFGAPEAKVTLTIDQQLLQLLEQETAGEVVRPVRLQPGDYFVGRRQMLDHGASVPLYYLQQAGLSIPGLHLTISLFPYKDLYRFGQSLRRALELRNLPAAVIASADLSHRLTRGAPAGYSPQGAEFDRLVVELLRERRVEELLNIDPGLVEQAGECGLRSIIIALGMLAGEEFNSEIISYEGPFGVGYLVAALYPRPGGDLESDITAEQQSSQISPVELAREALEHYLMYRSPFKLPSRLPPLFKQRSGAFVTIKKGKELRGCIGTVEPVRSNLAEEISANAVSAGLKDPRFNPVSLEELDQLTISVDVLTPLQKVKNMQELDPKKYGVVVKSRSRSGVLLPDLEGVDTVGEQVSIARRKAGITPGEPVKLYRFQVERYS
ncbi:MAG TPA: AmmeMemoRadiSam system protein A [Firmicutes bacterium]|nr:AmmeMemoRadiSam system protein A [Bacillota bacterium]